MTLDTRMFLFPTQEGKGKEHRPDASEVGPAHSG